MNLELDLTGWHILIVDENFHAANTLKKLLEHYRAEVHWAGSSVAGLIALRDIPRPNLILCSISIPQMGALGFLNDVLKTPGKADIPVAVITTEFNEAEALEMMKKGFRGYIKKAAAIHFIAYAIVNVGRPHNADDDLD